MGLKEVVESMTFDVKTRRSFGKQALVFDNSNFPFVIKVPLNPDAEPGLYQTYSLAQELAGDIAVPFDITGKLNLLIDGKTHTYPFAIVQQRAEILNDALRYATSLQDRLSIVDQIIANDRRTLECGLYVSDSFVQNRGLVNGQCFFVDLGKLIRNPRLELPQSPFVNNMGISYANKTEYEFVQRGFVIHVTYNELRHLPQGDILSADYQRKVDVPMIENYSREISYEDLLLHKDKIADLLFRNAPGDQSERLKTQFTSFVTDGGNPAEVMHKLKQSKSGWRTSINVIHRIKYKTEFANAASVEFDRYYVESGPKRPVLYSP